ncbi:PAS domain-containing protein [Halorubrum cibi]|uniref:PAS domain S-box-containing protein n=1 Tax=Halorubrum cibi TaxID=413815 RepID=A0A521F323_9EURY|nr:PAS domain-containing protein [Halorubrum cibi]SMO90021.1 PAS domain S-box-containing protein [Halorubrum cibi]
MATRPSIDYEDGLNKQGLLSDFGDGIKILHIEDEPDFADLVSTFLQREREEFEIITKTDPREGLEAAVEEDIQCVVSDYDMPGLTGLDVLKQVREECPNLPFILFTGKGSEEIASEAITAGVTEYLQKRGGTDQYTVLANRIEQAVARRHAEVQVERSMQAIETAHDGISLLTDNGEFIYVNHAYADIMGYEREELIGEHFEILFPEEDIHTAYDEIIPTARQSGVWRGESICLTKDSDPITVDHLLSFTSEETMICTISEKDAAETVREELSLKERAMDEAPIGITITDPAQDENPLIYTNDEFLETTGYDRDEMVGRNCRFLQGDETREERVAEMRRAIEAEEPISVELRNYRKDGELFWNRVTIAPLYDEDGELEHFVGFQEDVTSRRGLIEEYRSLGTVLSHDMQNPLETVRGRLELAIEDDETKHVEAAMPSLERLEELIDDVAGVLKSGTIVGEHNQINIGRLAESVWEALDRCDEGHTIRVKDSITVKGDRDAVQRMFDNVLGNTIEHGETPVTVQIGELDDGFYIEDNGPGIPEENREQVFEQGFSTKESGDGTGMGMASVRQIVLALGWRIDITGADELDGVRFEIHTE